MAMIRYVTIERFQNLLSSFGFQRS